MTDNLMEAKTENRADESSVDISSTQSDAGKSDLKNYASFDELDVAFSQESSDALKSPPSPEQFTKAPAQPVKEGKSKSQSKKAGKEVAIPAEKIDAKPTEEEIKEAIEETPLPSESDKEPGPQVPEGTEKMAPDAEKSEFKPIKAKFGDQAIEMHPETTFKIKTQDGPEIVSIDDLMRNYKGKQNWDRKFTDINQIKQKHENEAKRWSQQVEDTTKAAKNFFENIEQGLIRDAMDDLCRITGQDPEEQWSRMEQIQSQNVSKIQEFSEEELNTNRLKEENEYWKRKHQRANNEEEQKKVYGEVQEKLDKVKGELDVTDDHLRVANDDLIKMQKEGKWNQPITVEDIGNHALNVKILEKVDKLVVDHFPELRGNEELYFEILKDTREKGLKDSDWEDIVKGLKSQRDSTSNLERKVAKTKSVSKKGSSSPSKEIISWDDIDENIVTFS